MADIVAQSADGQFHSFPEGTDPSVIDKVMKQYAAANAPAQKPSSFVDVVRSIPGGLAKGVAAVAGIPGDLQQLVNRGTDAVLGAPNPNSMAAKGQGQFLPLPTSQGINDTVSKPFGGYYEPQTTAGHYADTIAQFAPAAIAPGSIAARAARVVIPGAASETAGQLTKGTAAEPYARVIGALAGGVAQGLGEGVMAERATSKAIPSTKDLKTAAGQSYQAADQAGLVIKGGSFDSAIDGIATDLESRGINPRIPPQAQARLFPKASAALETLQAAKGSDIGLSDLDKLRQVARVALESNDKADRSVAHSIIDGLDSFVNGLKPSDVASGNAQDAVGSLNDARALWTKASKSDVIDRAITKAENTGSQFTGAGKENAYRVQFRALAKNEKAMAQFSPDEQAAIKRVADGGAVENVLRFFGKFSPHGALTSLGSGAVGYEAAGLPGAAGALAAGEVARQGATALTTRNARLASETVRSGAPVARQLAGPIARAGVVSGALSAPQLTNSYADRITSLSAAVRQ